MFSRHSLWDIVYSLHSPLISNFLRFSTHDLVLSNPRLQATPWVDRKGHFWGCFFNPGLEGTPFESIFWPRISNPVFKKPVIWKWVLDWMLYKILTQVHSLRRGAWTPRPESLCTIPKLLTKPLQWSLRCALGWSCFLRLKWMIGVLPYFRCYVPLSIYIEMSM